jgi:aryl-alcohol dehydrogenase-like predicted oxidoreductase
MTRREFLQAALAATVLPAVGCGGRGGDRMEQADGIPMRSLGRTGEAVSVIGIGGFHLGIPSEEEGIRIIRTAVDGGITFLDNCWDYHDGESERRMGKALRDGYRSRVFLMTKIDGRNAVTAARQIDESLQHLQVDRIDLMQLHEVIRESDPERTFALGGAIEALEAAKAAGKIRFIGFTGHKSPRFHLAMLRAAEQRGFRFDAVQMPLNVLDAHFDSFERNVLPALVQQGIGVLGMKPMADGRIVQRGHASADECLRYAMSLPVSTVITGCESLERAEQALRVARGFQPLPEPEVNALLARTASAAQTGEDEGYKTTESYDGTTQNPSWLG